MELSKMEAKMLFSKFYHYVRRLGFDEITPEEELQVKEIIDYDELNLLRVEETKNQVSLKKEINGYKIKIRTSYYRKQRNFTKAGRIWIRIFTMKKGVGEKAIYTSYFKRMGDQFIQRACDEITFLVHALNHRPIDTQKKRMELKGNSKRDYNWVSVNNPKEKVSFYHSIPNKIKSEILKTKRTRRYYQTDVRPRLGITRREKDIRIVRHPRTPAKILPSY